jgi:hypothetical protein
VALRGKLLIRSPPGGLPDLPFPHSKVPPAGWQRNSVGAVVQRISMDKVPPDRLVTPWAGAGADRIIRLSSDVPTT